MIQVVFSSIPIATGHWRMYLAVHSVYNKYWIRTRDYYSNSFGSIATLWIAVEDYGSVVAHARKD